MFLRVIGLVLGGEFRFLEHRLLIGPTVLLKDSEE